MEISVFGLGYVGCVSVGCLAQGGHHIIGVDIDENKVDLINQGHSTIVEKDIDSLIEQYNKSGNIEATCDTNYAVLNSDISIVCVGTPSSKEGCLDLSYLYRVVEQIALALKEKDSFHSIVIRSTVQPGTCAETESIIERITGKIRDINFGVVLNPEFLREGLAVQDYYNPAFILLASTSSIALDNVEKIYTNINAPIYKTEPNVAEIIKYVNNSFHALKITFANEVGNICKALNIDSHKVMDLFCKDTKLNISSAYFKPGFAYGGSCLPKDLNALIQLAESNNINTPILNNIEKSNEAQKEIVIQQIMKTGKKKVGILGLSFKAGTDDLRGSPIIDVIIKLIDQDYEIKIHDSNLNLEKLIGSNKNYLNTKIPNISSLFSSLNNVLDSSEILVVVNEEQEYKDLFSCILKSNEISGEITNLRTKTIIDLVRIAEEINIDKEYQGICW
ncbi:MAG: nucleotide sugar dehydrogenase [Candidatus Gastranaerophilales bacterium]|nr:nucleotide sugar dehydrogenase [Candidatus Gastranaerophilales bacterium]